MLAILSKSGNVLYLTNEDAMDSFVLYWLDGKCETLLGFSIGHAMSRAGYSAGASRALDFYESMCDKPNYEWTGNKWEKISVAIS